jgi:hypothetical protein
MPNVKEGTCRAPGGRGLGKEGEVVTGHTPASHLSPMTVLSLLEERLSSGGKTLGPLVRDVGGWLLPLVTCLFRDTACSTLESVTRRLVGPFRRRTRHRRPPAAATSSSPGRSLRQWLCAPSRNEKDSRPSIFIQVSHNPPPFSSLPAFG